MRTRLIDGGSFKDPAGFVFFKDGKVFRYVNRDYASIITQLVESGLYENLVRPGMLLPFKILKPESNKSGLTLEVKKIPFISYPFEWPFGMLKDAALLTLSIQRLAINQGMSLKDASAYNVQWLKGKPIFIDHTSFEKYEEGKPWIAYKQFCEHFIGPLALWAYADVELYRLQREFIDGIPLRLVSRLLPKKTLVNRALLMHLHWHAKNQTGKTRTIQGVKSLGRITKSMLLAIIDDLERLVRGMKLKNSLTEWKDYYEFTNYSRAAFEHKKKVVHEWALKIKPKVSWDGTGGLVIGFDIDPLAVEAHYTNIKETKDESRLALIMDLANPSPGLGWGHCERQSLVSRGKVDLVLALALVHHLRIGLNVPLRHIARWMAELGTNLLIEWVPKTDSQLKKMLATRHDVYADYQESTFEKEFLQFFTLEKKVVVDESQRWLYLWKKR